MQRKEVEYVSVYRPDLRIDLPPPLPSVTYASSLFSHKKYSMWSLTQFYNYWSAQPKHTCIIRRIYNNEGEEMPPLQVSVYKGNICIYSVLWWDD